MAVLNPGLADLSDDDRQVLESWLVEFAQGWDEGLLANRLDQIPPGSSWRLPALAEMVKIDLQRHWGRGRQISLESYLAEFPELGSPGDVSADLIQAEYEVRRQFGAALTLEEYVRRFPHQAGELARLITQGGSALSRHASVAAPSRSSSRAQGPTATPAQLPEQFGRYRIIKRLGQGGMGSVYLAQDTYLQRPVALKVPDFGPHEDPEARKRFLEEARTAATLDHPYLCPVHDAGEIDGQPYLTMAYIQGQSLAALIGTEGWPQRQVAALVGKLALALHEAHKRKVVHRDLKPANVMIKTTGQRREPVIVDFGLAHRDNPQEQRLTRSGQVMGTLGYMAPEQIRGDLKEIGPGCDIYALGVILYELLTGRLPFSGSGLAIAGQILTQAPLPPSTHRSDLDPALEAICLKAMAKMVGDRYTSMAELATALTGFLQSLSASSAPAASAGSPASPLSASGERTQPAGSNSLVGQFLNQLAGTKAPPAPIPCRERIASRSPLREHRRPTWPTIVVASVLGVMVLGVIIYVATDKGRITIAVNDPKAVVKIDGEEVRIESLGAPITLRAGTHEMEVKWGDGQFKTRSFVVRRWQNEALRIEYVPQIEKEKSTNAEKAPTPIHWPEVPALAGQTLPVQVQTRPSVPKLDSEAPKDGFQSLFNGKNLAGWNVDGGDASMWRESMWEVEKGVIIARGQNFKTRSYLLTDREYSDFVLRLEFNLEKGSGSGLSVRAIPGDQMPLPNGNRIFDHPLFKLIESPGREETGTTHWIRDSMYVKPDRPAELSPVGSWNRVEIEVTGHSMSASVNGKPVLNTTLGPRALFPDGTVPALNRATGRIGLQKHTGTVRFRKIEIKESNGTAGGTGGLPTGPVQAVVGELQAPPANAPSLAKEPASSPVVAKTSTKGEFQPLFDGKDLAGWKPHPKQPGNWHVDSSGVLIGSGPQDSHLYSECGTYKDFHLRVSARINNGGNSGVFVRASSELARPVNNPRWPDGYEAQINSTHWNQDRTGSLRGGVNGAPVVVVRDSLIPPGQWFELEVIVEGNRIVIIVDGKKTAEYIDENRLYTIGHIVLQQMNGSVVEFRKIEIKELNGTAGGTAGVPTDPTQTAAGGTQAPPAAPAPGVEKVPEVAPGAASSTEGKSPRPLAAAAAGSPAPQPAERTGVPRSAHSRVRAGSTGLPKEIINKIGMKLVLIPAGEFEMGSPESDRDALHLETPQHRVRITRPFYLGVTEVTQGQYWAVTGERPSHFRGPDDLPVEMVSWNDAIAFCDKLSEREGLKPYDRSAGRRPSGGDGYRLPTEAEWEYACRAGSTTRYSFGDDVANLDEYAWWRQNSGFKTHPVGQKHPNAFGLYDMYGNVWEWCLDYYDAEYYRQTKALTLDPSGPSSATGRVMRGGCYGNFGSLYRSAYRFVSRPPVLREDSKGFRVARLPSGP